jgi:hypothetical protein
MSALAIRVSIIRSVPARTGHPGSRAAFRPGVAVPVGAWLTAAYWLRAVTRLLGMVGTMRLSPPTRCFSCRISRALPSSVHSLPASGAYREWGRTGHAQTVLPRIQAEF